MKWLVFSDFVLLPVVVLASCSDSNGISPTGDAGNDAADSGPTADSPVGDDGGGDAPADVHADGDAAPPLTGKYLWAKRFGNDPNGSVSGEVAIDSSGNIVIAGGFTKTVDFGGGTLTSAGGLDIFVVKFDPTGKHLWSKRFGDPGLQNAVQPAIDAAGNIFVVGGFEGTVNFGGADLTSAGGEDAFLLKLDANGNHVWSKRFGGTGTEVSSGIAVNGTNIVLLGTFTSTIDFGGGGLSPAPGQFLATLTASAGDHVWSKVPANVSGVTTLYQEHVRVDGAGNIVFAGGFTGSIDFGGGALTTPGGSEDVFVVKYSSGGVHTSSKRFGGTGGYIGKDLAVGSSGSIIMTGETSNSIDFGSGAVSATPGVFVTALDSSGVGTWAKAFSFRTGSAWSVASDGDGRPVIAGNYFGPMDFGGGPLPDGNDSAYLARFDGAGNFGWAKSWSGRALSVAVDQGSNVIVAGFCFGTVDLGGGALPCGGSPEYDLVLAKFAP